VTRIRILAVLVLLGTARIAAADEAVPFAAHAGVATARAAALSWSPDAALVWVENDEAPGPLGVAGRWSYLYYSATTDQARVYSVRDGRILAAENLDMKFDAPPVADDWIDSGRAFTAAEAAAAQGDASKKAPRGALRAMVLARGTMDAAEPDRTTWTLVYSSPGAPSTFVVVDAASAKVLRTWRG